MKSENDKAIQAHVLSAKHGHERECGEDVHGNVWASSCERCGD